MKVEKGKSASSVGYSKVEEKEDKKVGKCPNCEKPVTSEELKNIFPDATEEKRKIVAETYSKYMKELGMNTCWNKAHFFAQAKVESGDALSLKEGEGFNYYWESLISTFKAFQSKEGKEKAKLWGRSIKDRRNPKAIDVPKENQIKIANYAYSPPAAKAKELGNTEPNDGWNYRGRGLIQVTGKAFYQYCNPYTLKYNNIDVLQNPDAIGERLDLCVSSGMIFFKWKSINKLANTTKDVKNKICPLVGKDIIRDGISKNYQLKQDAFDKITSKVFKVDECTFNKDIKQELKNSKCPKDCSQCFDYSDVVENPRLNNQSNNVNKNRFKREKRYNKKHPRPKGYYHTGTDILAKLNTNVKSMLCGEVVEAFDTGGDLGKIVTIKSKDKNSKFIWIRYCHLNSFSVSKGQKIKHGGNIGKSGNTGNAKNILPQYYHVHIEASTNGVFYGGNTRVDPEDYMKTKFDETKKGNPIK